MLTKRIIPCLDVDKGRVVKGVNFVNLRDAGDPVLLAQFYDMQGADELVFLDITATSDNRQIMTDVVKKVSSSLFIPFTVGGGIRSIADMKLMLLSGADKVAINTSAINNPQLITDGANILGSQCIVVAIDVKRKNNTWEVYINGGRKRTGIDAAEWAKKVVSFGAGEILLTSMDRDGTKDGYDVELTKTISQIVSIPVIASGGAGTLDDFKNIFENGNADGALAASLFHFGELSINQVKKYLQDKKIPIRISN